MTPKVPANRKAYSKPKADLFLPTKASAENQAVRPVSAFDLFSAEKMFFSKT